MELQGKGYCLKLLVNMNCYSLFYFFKAMWQHFDTVIPPWEFISQVISEYGYKNTYDSISFSSKNWKQSIITHQ